MLAIQSDGLAKAKALTRNKPHQQWGSNLWSIDCGHFTNWAILGPKRMKCAHGASFQSTSHCFPAHRSVSLWRRHGSSHLSFWAAFFHRTPGRGKTIITASPTRTVTSTNQLNALISYKDSGQLIRQSLYNESHIIFSVGSNSQWSEKAPLELRIKLSPTNRQPTIMPPHLLTIPPSYHPTLLPSCHPATPSFYHPITLPPHPLTIPPSCHPTLLPSRHPATPPSYHPAIPPSYHPAIPPLTISPSCHPTLLPSCHLTLLPSGHPTLLPSRHPATSLSYHPATPPSYHPAILPPHPPTIPLSCHSHKPAAIS